MRYVVIMAGGSGTRLWPLSRKGEPKQLLPLVEGRSLLRLAYERVAAIVPDERILVCTGAAYADRVAEILPELPASNLLGEPQGRDSLNAVAWPAAVLARQDPDAVVAMLSADHVIEPVQAFQAALTEAFLLAETDPSALVTFGVVPTTAHTGFGYLRRGEDIAGFPNSSEVLEFREKPQLAQAEEYLSSGQYWWNSGMFVWRAATLLAQLRILLPDTFAQVSELAEHPERLDQIYPRLARTSVDYGVMEPVSVGRGSAHVVAVALPIDWRDVGSYSTLAELVPDDGQGNRTQGSVVTLDSANNLLINRCGEQTVLAVTGLTDTVVVLTPDATLVAPMAATQQVKDLVALVREQAGPELA